MGPVLILVLQASSVTLGESLPESLRFSWLCKIMTLSAGNPPCLGVWPNVLLIHSELKGKPQPLLKGQPQGSSWQSTSHSRTAAGGWVRIPQYLVFPSSGVGGRMGGVSCYLHSATHLRCLWESHPQAANSSVQSPCPPCPLSAANYGIRWGELWGLVCTSEYWRFPHARLSSLQNFFARSCLAGQLLHGWRGGLTLANYMCRAM